MPSASASHASRIASLDLLRSLAILGVVLAHTPFLTPGSWVEYVAGWGSLGVDLFFVLSGYLIASQWFADLRDGRGSYRTFFLRRALRIWPNYFAVITLALLIQGPVAANLGPLWRYVFFLQNYYPTQGLGPTWSLCIEEHFYLLFPLLSGLAYRCGARTAGRLLWLFAVLGLLSRFATWWWIRPDQLTVESPKLGDDAFYWYFYHPTHTRIDGLVFGVAIAAIRRFRSDTWQRLIRVGNGWIVAAILTFLVTVASSSTALSSVLPIAFLQPGAPSGRGLVSITVGAFGFDLAFAFLLLAALSPRSHLNRATIPGAQALALLSYAMYLTHSEIITWLETTYVAYGIPTQGWIPTSVMFGTITLGASALHLAVERPSLRLRDRWLSSAH